MKRYKQFLYVIIIALFVNVSVNIAKADTIPGDANSDGAVNVIDIIAIINMVFNNQAESVGADCNSSGGIDVLDIICAINTVFPTPTPTPTPGVDVSPVRGNTVSYNSIAEFDVSLINAPVSDVVIPVSSSNESEGVPVVSSLTFNPDNWNQVQTVAVKGRNRNVVNGSQDYRIVLSAVQSADARYNNFDPDDVDMKGVSLSVSEPTEPLVFISELERKISVDVIYTGNESLSFSLDGQPDGMIIDLNSGLISWTPAAEAEGNLYTFKVKVTDGVLFSEMNFNVSVSGTTPLQSNIEGNSITIIEQGSNLQGLSVQVIDSNLRATDISFEKLNDASSLPIVPGYISRITDFFLVKNPVSGDLVVKLPLAQVPDGTDLQQVGLYSLSRSSDIDEEFWSPIGTDVHISDSQGESIIEISLAGLEGAFFIGIESQEAADEEVVREPISFSRLILTRTQASDVTCNPEPRANGSLNYNRQSCSVSSNSGIAITVLGFGGSSTSTRWNGVTIQELIVWLIDARQGFNDLQLNSDPDFTVRIHRMPKPDWLGYVTAGSNENRKTLHLTSSNRSKSLMQATAVHEYFHHAQSRSGIAGRDLLIDGGDEKKWFIEGTAQWFEDYLYDAIDSYTFTEAPGRRILEEGLNSTVGRPYQRFSFVKMLQSKCSGFNNAFKDFLNIDRSLDASGILNLATQLEKNTSNCGFGSHMGSAKKSSLEAALVYYQYATLYKNKISLLDPDENDDGFSFQGTPYQYEQSDWFEVNEVDSTGEIDVSSITSVPAYGAYSIKIKSDWLTNADFDENHEAVFRVRTAALPLTVSLLSEDSSFVGNSQLDGIQHRYYRTNEQSEYIFSQDELVDFFITIVNPNDVDVAVEEIIFEVRNKLSPELEITSPSEGDSVNQRVISVTGTVPEEAADVDRILISNGDVKTVATVAADKSFAADVVMTMGSNILILQGYNSGDADFSTPLTKEKIININGIENTAGGENALVPSRVAFVLRWKTNNTDLDIYSTDKNNNTIWYRNKVVSPGVLDFDNTSGYGPEVISYRRTDDDVYVNGQFDVDVHFYSGSSTTAYSLDVIMNETDPSNLRVRHYESVQSLVSGNSSQNGPAGSGSARFNDVLSVRCNPERICSIDDVDPSKLSNTGISLQTNLSRYTLEDSLKDDSSFETCMRQYYNSLQKAGSVSWMCDPETGAKMW